MGKRQVFRKKEIEICFFFCQIWPFSLKIVSIKIKILPILTFFANFSIRKIYKP